MSLSGSIIDHECRLELMVCNPSDDRINEHVTAIIDTGCTRTAIREDIATRLQLPQSGVAQVHGFGGVQTAAIVVAKIVVASGTEAVSALSEVAIGKTSEMRDEMLFGMDGLAGGVLTVDGVLGTWRWQLKKLGVAVKSKKST